MTVSLSPLPKFKAFVVGTNAPLSAGKLYTYAAGTTTPLATYTSSTGLTLNANPVILDINGEADVWLGNSAYKFVLKDVDGATLWTIDNITRYATVSELNANNYLTSVSGVNTITASYSVGFAAYSTGQTFRFIAASTNTGSTTLNVNGIGAKSIVLPIGSQLLPATLVSGNVYEVFYDGTNFQLINGQISIDALKWGFKGDGTTDNYSKFTTLFTFLESLSSGANVAFPPGTYKVVDPNVTLGQIIQLNSASNINFIGIGNPKIIFSSAVSSYSFNLEECNNISIDGFYFQGAVSEGTVGTRAWGISARGGSNITYGPNNTYSTFEGISLFINRAKQLIGYNWIVAGNKNSVASVAALYALSASNVHINGGTFKYGRSNFISFFGVVHGKIKDVYFDVDSGLSFYSVLVDDASDHTELLDYAVNDDIEVSGLMEKNATANGGVRFEGVSKGFVHNNNVRRIESFSYDFDQQINNFGPATASPQASPFLWMNYITGKRGVLIEHNTINSIDIRSGGFCYADHNYIKAYADSQTLISEQYPSINWGGTPFYDSMAETAIDLYPTQNSISYNKLSNGGYQSVNGIANGIQSNFYTRHIDNQFLNEGAYAFSSYDVAASSSLAQRSYYYSTDGLKIKKFSNIVDTIGDVGNFNATVTAGTKTVSGSVVFSSTFASAPKVPSPGLQNGTALAAGENPFSISVNNVTTTGFSYQIYLNANAAADRVLTFSWQAIAQ